MSAMVNQILVQRKKQNQEETPDPQGKLHLEESKIVKEKHERSLTRNEKRIHIDTRVGVKASKDHKSASKNVEKLLTLREARLIS
jgi:hypothetical protein